MPEDLVQVSQEELNINISKEGVSELKLRRMLSVILMVVIGLISFVAGYVVCAQSRCDFDEDFDFDDDFED